MANEHIPETDSGDAMRADHSLDQRLGRYLGYRMRRASLVAMSNAATTLTPFGLRIGTFSALSVLNDQTSGSVSQLSIALSIEVNDCASALLDLTKDGMVYQHRDGAVTGDTVFEVTELGRKVCQGALLAMDRSEDALYGHLTLDEKDTLRHLLERIQRFS